MYQQQGNAYSNDGATKISGGGAGGANGGPNMMNGGGGYGSGYGAGGYGGAAGYEGSMYGGGSAYGAAAAQNGDANSLYGGGSMYGAGAANGGEGGGAGSMMMMGGEMQENIVVTKLFSSRRDLDRVASAVDFSRRFDSNWGSYRSTGADGYGGSIYGNGAADAGGSLMNLGGGRGVGSMTDRGVGAAGMGPDGAAPAAEERKEARPTPKSAIAKAPREPATEMTATETSAAEPSAKKPAAERAVEVAPAKPPAKSPATATKAPQPPAPVKKPVEAAPQPQPQPPAKAVDAAPKTESRALPMQEPARAVQAEEKVAPQPQQPAKAVQAREVVPSEAKPREAPPLDDIPLLADDVLPRKKAPTPKAATPAAPPPQPTKAPTPPTVAPPPARTLKAKEVMEATRLSTPKEATPPAAAKNAARGAEGTRPMRPRSRPHSRPQSRMTSMSVVEFPEADEVKDEMVKDGLNDPEKEAALAAAREEQKRQREDASRQARLERARQRQALEDVQKQRDEEARRAREAKAEEERQKKELIAKMDEQTRQERAAALAARQREREEEKRRFEEAKRAEEEKEAARARAAIAERQRQLAEKEAQEREAPHEKSSRPVSRPRSRRPASRPSSNLRGAIPEQPPDVVAGQMKDTLADDNLGKPSQATSRAAPTSDTTVVEVHRPARHAEEHQPSEQQQQPHSQATPASRGDEAATAKPHLSQEPSPASQQSHGSRASPASAKKDDGRAAQPHPTPTTQKELNMVKTFVLVEAARNGNNAVQHTPESITYHDQTVNVTELKVREEDCFSYQSNVVHDVREAACRGYNAAVLSMDTANSVSRFNSPVWSTLLRIVRSLLLENSNEAGELRENFELTWAMGYLYRDKIKDLLMPEDEAQFTKVAVNPSPIYGPRLMNLKYETVTDPKNFEDMLPATLQQGADDPTVGSLSEGVLAAFVLVKQTRETDGKPDIYLSSLVVASCGEDPMPYQSAISHTRNEYATVFHLVLGGPSCTCFMLNIGDDDTVRKSGETSQQSVPENLEAAMALLAQMANLQNYDLRSGSVKRFIKYVERSHTNAKQRLAKEQDESQRRKVERYLKEQERLLDDAYGLLREANIQVVEEL